MISFESFNKRHCPEFSYAHSSIHALRYGICSLDKLQQCGVRHFRGTVDFALKQLDILEIGNFCDCGVSANNVLK